MEQFKDSDTLEVSKTLLLAVAGPTGSGKTESAMRIARGIVGPNGTFGVIDSENKRALNKKSRYRFNHLDMQAPYSPEHFRELIEASIAAGHKATVVDSWSAEWDDDGGLSDMAEQALERMSKGDAARAERLTSLAWREPKGRHKAFMRWARKLEHPIIFALRAEPKIKYVKDDKGKTQVVDAGWLPITEKLFGYDMLVYALMMAENPGVPVHLKKLEQDFEPMFPAGKQITERCGELLVAWATPKTPKAEAKAGETTDAGAHPPAPAANGEFITPDQHLALEDDCRKIGRKPADLLAAMQKAGFDVPSLAKMPAAVYERATGWIERQRKSELS